MIIYPKPTKEDHLRCLDELQDRLSKFNEPIGFKAGKGGLFYADKGNGFFYHDVEMVKAVITAAIASLRENSYAAPKLLSELEELVTLFGYQNAGFPLYFQINSNGDIYVWMFSGNYTFNDAVLTVRVREDVINHVTAKITEIQAMPETDVHKHQLHTETDDTIQPA
jgi:hypothetical protein